MEKPAPSSSAGAGHAQSALKALNKNSYKISKSHPKNPNPPPSAPPPPPPPPPPADPPALPPQPPVYNIDKNDFRDVVQKLTGSPAHLYPPAPAPPPLPPVPAPLLAAAAAAAAAAMAAPSRLHRNRPPPLAAARPPVAAGAAEPWSPLPPLPGSSVPAESPITAYMRRLRSGGPPSPLGFGVLPSPRTACQMLSAPPPTSPGVPMPATSPRLGGSDQ